MIQFTNRDNVYKPQLIQGFIGLIYMHSGILHKTLIHIIGKYMDRITKQLLSDFLATQEFKASKPESDFELFCNYAVISSEYNKTFDIQDVSVGAGDDTGIDGLGIIVNGHLVQDSNEVDDLMSQNGYLEVTYVFVQAKTSPSMDTKELNSFYNGIVDFFEENPKLRRNEEIQKFAELSNYILDLAPDFKENPKCKAYYIYTGSPKEDQNVEAIKDIYRDRIGDYNIFNSTDEYILGANDLSKLYRKTKNPVSVTFTFQNKVALPPIEHVDQAYYGYLPFTEFKKIIIDDNGNIRSVFDDNVRDFQGASNAVNQSISETLVSDTPTLFGVLNNGITIVADSIKTSANKFVISDYQIVNGCQSSNVLYENRNIEGIDDVCVPIRLIVTDNDDVKSNVTVSTNNQTAIKKEQLTAMSDFQKNLEHYYNTITGDGRLYYERRAKQYDSDREVVRRRIVTVANQIKSFASMFEQNPHMVTSYYGSIVKSVGKEDSAIFSPDHHFSSYYMSALAYYRMDSLFNSGDLDKKYKKVKFYLLMLFPLLASDENFPPLNSVKKVDKYCNPIIKLLDNEAKYKAIFNKAVAVIDASGANIEDKQSVKSKSMTTEILEHLPKIKEKAELVEA